MKWFLPVFFILFVFAPNVYAQESTESQSMFCTNKVLRWLFNVNCESNVNTSQSENTAQDTNKSLKLRFFVPPPTSTPTPTLTPTLTLTPTPGYTNPNPSQCRSQFNGTCRATCSLYETNKGADLCGSTGQSCCVIQTIPTTSQDQNIPVGQKFPSSDIRSISTEQVDWTFNDIGRCWSAWVNASCSLLPHEGGGDASVRDFDGDGKIDIECSQGTGSRKTTTVKNVSSKSITLRCERYGCAECKSGNTTHAQCDRGVDASAQRIATEYTVASGQSATCTTNGIEGVNQSLGENPTPITQVTQIPTGSSAGILIPTSKPTSQTPSPSSNVRDLIKEAGNFFATPWQVVEAIMKIEGDHIFGLSSSDVLKYQKPGAKVPTNCTPNVCSAAGPAQFTTGRDQNGSASCSGCGLSSCPNAWALYSTAVSAAVNDNRTPNVCNLKDSIYAASKKLKNDSRTLSNDTSWTYSDVYKAAQAYYGSCTACNVARSGTGAYYACRRLGMTYCDYTWQYYQNNK